MQRLALKFGTLTAVGLLSACNGGPQFQQLPSNIMEGFPAVGVMKEARSAKPSGAFDTAAYTDLMKHAEYEYVQTDYKDAMFHANKAIAAARGEAIAPQNPAERMLPADKVAEIQDAYARLNTALAGDMAAADPESAGVALGSFDCWIEQQQENFQEADIAACRDAFYAALAKLEKKEEMAEMATLNADLFFDFDKYVIKPEALPQLDELAKLLVADTTANVLVWGFTDTVGSVEYNLGLSERRANAVAEYLASKGVDASRMTVEGFGKERSKLRVQTPDQTPNAENRRVEIRRR
ncbi:MAG: OmpA family protein [Geminicoccaceae bacterium]